MNQKRLPIIFFVLLLVLAASASITYFAFPSSSHATSPSVTLSRPAAVTAAVIGSAPASDHSVFPAVASRTSIVPVQPRIRRQSSSSPASFDNNPPTVTSESTRYRVDWRSWIHSLLPLVAADTSRPLLDSAIIEVGTGEHPDFSAIAQRRSGTLYIGIDPLHDPVKLAQDACAEMKERCVIIHAAVSPALSRNNNTSAATTMWKDVPSLHESDDDFILLNVASHPHCSSILQGGKRCGAPNDKKEVRRVRRIDVAEILKLLPASIRSIEIATDCQGADLHCLRSIDNGRALSLDPRVTAVIFECQDVNMRRKLQYLDASTCGEIRSCLQQHWDFEVARCSENLEVMELNCVMRRKSLPPAVVASTLVHPFQSDKVVSRIRNPGLCPNERWNS